MLSEPAATAQQSPGNQLLGNQHTVTMATDSGAVATTEAPMNLSTASGMLQNVNKLPQSLGVTTQPPLIATHPSVYPTGTLVPQLVMAGPGPSPGTPTMVPVQQLIIPVSAAGGQQYITIPVSLAAGAAGHAIQLLTNSNGQMLATNLTIPSLQTFPSTPVPISETAMSSGPIQATVPASGLQHTLGTLLPTTSTFTLPSSHAISNITPPSESIAANSFFTAIQAPYFLGSTVLPSTGVFVGTNQPTTDATSLPAAPVTNVTPSVPPPPTATNRAPTNDCGTAPPSDRPINYALVHEGRGQLRQQPVIVHSQAISKQVTLASNLVPRQAIPVEQHPQIISTNAPRGTANTSHSTVNALHGTASTHLTSILAARPANVNGVPPSISELLPSKDNLEDTVNNSEGTTVDGINLDEIKEFARSFKLRRLSLGLTQTQVGQALSATEGPAYSQSAICRFEKLDITPKSAQKIKPVLERWMQEAEERHKNGGENLNDFIGCEPSKKRKRRTSFTPSALEVLNDFFEKTTHPSGSDMTVLSSKLSYDREVIRVWFCNKRQALKNTIKKLRQDRFDRAQYEGQLQHQQQQLANSTEQHGDPGANNDVRDSGPPP